MRVPSDEYDDDIVVEVLQEGYLLVKRPCVRPWLKLHLTVNYRLV